MSFKNKRKRRHGQALSSAKLELLRDAEKMLQEGYLHDALPLLKEAVRDYPSEVRFWEMLAFAGTELNDVQAMLNSYSRLTQMQPRNSTTWFGLAYTYALDQRPALAYRGFQEFLRRFPGNEKTEAAATLLEIAEKDLRGNLAGFGFPDGEEGVGLACLHEEAQTLMNQGRLAEAREKAENLITRMPDFVPAYNNLSLILFMDGDAESAADAARAALVKDPDNCHALANLVRFSTFLDKPVEAGQFADRLRKVKRDAPDILIKKMEAFAFLGDDETVVEIFKAAEKQKAEFREEPAMIRHLAAYSFYRLGDEKNARRLWRKTIEEDPNFDLALDNLDEFDLPEKEREFFAMPLTYWIPRVYVDELIKATGKIQSNRNFEKNLQKKIATFFEKNPGILTVLSMMLDRGDAFAKGIAIKLMSWAGTPQSNAALKDFALGQNGSEGMRYKAAIALTEAGVISNNVRLWREGEWRETRLMTFEISGEPVETYPLKPKAQQMLAKGYEATQKQNLELAEKYYKMALDANGADHPSVLFNLLAIDQMRGRYENTETTLRKMVEDFPDYTFAAISLATMEVKKGNIEAAKNLTDKFYDKKQWHFTEISGWLHFNIELALAEKQFDSARMYLDTLRNIDDNPAYDDWGDVILKREMAHKLLSIPSKLIEEKKKK